MTQPSWMDPGTVTRREYDEARRSFSEHHKPVRGVCQRCRMDFGEFEYLRSEYPETFDSQECS